MQPSLHAFALFPGAWPSTSVSRVTAPEPSFFTRFLFAFACFFRVLFDPGFARAARALADGDPAEGATPALPAGPAPAPETKPVVDAVKSRAPSHDSALALLALLQREGRLVDFLEEDVLGFPDADLGAAARVVHAGCRKALREHVKLAPVRAEEEGARLTLPAGFDAALTKLTGNVTGSGPYTGTLKHRGYRALEVSLPTALEGHDARVVAQAEVEL